MLLVKNLSVAFSMYETNFAQKQAIAITNLNLEINPGELVAVVGASGSGKSLLAHAVLGILPHNAKITGEIIYQGEPLTFSRQTQLRGKEITLIPQSISYLDPLMTVGRQIYRAAHQSGLSKSSIQQAIDGTLERYQLDLSVKKLYPFQLSGGMARRVLIAIATVGNANLIIADEPTSSLNPELVSETLNHLRQLADTGKGVMLITHDLSAVLEVADKVAIFYQGTTLEVVFPSDFHQNKLQHPYSQALWQALPENDFIATPSWCVQLEN